MKKRRIGIIKQISLLFIIGILFSGSLTYFSQHAASEGGVKREREKLASQIATQRHEILATLYYNHKQNVIYAGMHIMLSFTTRFLG